MADQKSSHYNWFKGDSSNGGKKSSKESAKTVWKFSKIFLYFSLFFVSMWGCVQTFVTKTDTAVGRGVELYADQESIAPQVSSIHITKQAEGIYTIDKSTDNIWLNTRTNDKETQLFNDVIKSIKDQTKAGDTYTLDQANKGINGVARLVVDGKEDSSVTTTRGIVLDGNKPLVFTTEADLSKFTAADTSSVGPTFTIYNYEVQNVNNKYTTTVTPITLDLGTIVADIQKNPESIRNYNFNAKYVKQILAANGLGDAIKKFPQPSVQTSVDQKTLDGWKTNIDRHNAYVSTVLDMLGVKIKDASKGTLEYSGGVLGLSSNKYTPIATWSQAWDMHRGAGPFYGIFVYPISWVTNKLIATFPMMAGWESFLAIVLVVVVISLITFLLSFKGTLQQTRMQELNAKKAVIDAKYAPYKGNKQMEMRQRQEVSELYKKEGINPLSSITTIFVTMPFFFAMWRVIGTIPHIKGTIWLGINFAATSYKELFAGHVQYLPLMVLAVVIQLFSQIYPRLLTRRRDKNRMNVHQKAAMKKGNKMQNIMLIVFGAMALIFSAGLQVYFIVRSLWRIVEVQLTHHILVRQRKQRVKKAI